MTTLAFNKFFHSLVDCFVIKPNNLIAKLLDVSPRDVGMGLIVGGATLFLFVYPFLSAFVWLDRGSAIALFGEFMIFSGSLYLVFLPKLN